MITRNGETKGKIPFQKWKVSYIAGIEGVWSKLEKSRTVRRISSSRKLEEIINSFSKEPSGVM